MQNISLVDVNVKIQSFSFNKFLNVTV